MEKNHLNTGYFECLIVKFPIFINNDDVIVKAFIRKFFFDNIISLKSFREYFSVCRLKINNFIICNARVRYK